MHRYLLTFSLLFLLGCTTTDIAAPPADGISFVHLNDIYRVGDVDSGNSGGLGRVVTVVREQLERGRDVRVLHGGDFLYPSLESRLWDGQQMIEALNFIDALAPMLVVPGNHEFDPRRHEPLAAAVAASNFTWLADNYRLKSRDEALNRALKSAYTFRSGERTIGVFAVTLHAADGGNARDYLEIDRDYVGAAKAAILALEAAGADAIVGLTHVHLWQDLNIAQLKAQHPGLAFIAGGHEHEPQYAPGSAAVAPVVKGASNAREIWVIDLDFDSDGRPLVSERRVALDGGVAMDAEYQLIADKWRARLLEKYPFLEARLGTAALPLDAREETVRSVESNWANFIVDRMRGAFGEPEADLAFINGGTLRIDDFISGDIRFEDVGRTFGFSSYLRLTEMSGAEFRSMLEAGFRGGDAAQGYFPQVSGFRVCVDRTRPEFERIASLQVHGDGGWAEIETDRLYSVVVTDFIWGGGDGYKMPQGRSASRPGSELKYLVLDEILNLQGAGLEIGEAVDPANPRIVILREPKQPCWQ